MLQFTSKLLLLEQIHLLKAQLAAPISEPLLQHPDQGNFHDA